MGMANSPSGSRLPRASAAFGRPGKSGSCSVPGRAARIAGLLFAGILAAACEPTIISPGHVWRGTSAEEIQPGVDTRAAVFQRIGSPTAEGLEQGTPWIYVSDREMKRGARSPVALEQQVVVIRFDSQDRVQSVDVLGPEDRIDIAISAQETLARGQELTLLQQLLGNVGRFESR